MNFFVVLQQMLALFAMIFIGFYAYKVHWVTQDTSDRLSKLLVNILNPALLINGVLDKTVVARKDLLLENLFYIFLYFVLLIGLCSYLYQGCFLMQAAYTVAFRSAAQERPDAGYADGQLNQLLEGEVLSFGKEERQIKAGMLRVEVTLERETPLARLAAVGDRGRLKVKPTAYVRNAAAYIRGIRRGKELGDE